jgi:hypothetical protein
MLASRVAGRRAPPYPRGPPQAVGAVPSSSLSSCVVDRANELCISVVHPPHYELVLSTVSVGCAVVHGQCLCSPSRQPSTRLHPRHAAHPAHHCRSLRALWPLTWSIHDLRFGPRQAWQRPIVRALTLELCVGGVAPHGPASLAVGHAGLVLFGSMAGPQQAECALCMWAARLGFGPVAVSK